MKSSSKPADNSKLEIANDERRSFPRVSSQCMVDYRQVSDDPMFQEMRNSHRGMLQNISGGGVCVRMPRDPGKGSLLALNIQLPQFPTSVIALGRVCWSVPVEDGESDVGIEFWWIGWQDASVQEQIRGFIAKRLNDGGAV